MPHLIITLEIRYHTRYRYVLSKCQIKQKNKSSPGNGCVTREDNFVKSRDRLRGCTAQNKRDLARRRSRRRRRRQCRGFSEVLLLDLDTFRSI